VFQTEAAAQRSDKKEKIKKSVGFGGRIAEGLSRRNAWLWITMALSRNRWERKGKKEQKYCMMPLAFLQSNFHFFF
jgi:hypothetical protein